MRSADEILNRSLTTWPPGRWDYLIRECRAESTESQMAAKRPAGIPRYPCTRTHLKLSSGQFPSADVDHGSDLRSASRMYLVLIQAACVLS